MTVRRVANFLKVFEVFLPISALRSNSGPRNGFRGHTRYSGYRFFRRKKDVFA
jgi:hypothetical protein